MDLQDPQATRSLTNSFKKAVSEGDTQTATNSYNELQSVQAAEINFNELTGRSPFAGTPATAEIPPEARQQMDAVRTLRLRYKLNQVHESPDFAGAMTEWNSILQEYRANNSVRITDIQNEQDPAKQAELQQGLNPVLMDPNRLASFRQMMTKVNNQLREIDPGLNIYNYPGTAQAAQWLNREMASGSIMVSGEQPDPRGAVARGVGDVAQMLYAAENAVFDIGVNTMEGVKNLANMGLKQMGLPEAFSPVTNYILDENGKVVPQVGVSPGLHNMAQMAIMSAAGYNQSQIERWVAENNAAEHFVGERKNDFEKIMQGIGVTAGHIGGIGALTGKATQVIGAMGYGQIMSRGMSTLVAGKIGAERTTALAQRLSSISAEMVVGGTYDALVHGTKEKTMEGMARNFMGGALVTLPILGLGQLGRRARTALKQKRVPDWLAARMDDAVVGLGMPIVGAAGLSKTWQPTWDVMRDPSNEQSWQDYVSSAMGMMLLGSMRGRSGVFDTEGQRRDQELRKAAMGPAGEAGGPLEAVRQAEMAREQAAKGGDVQAYLRAEGQARQVREQVYKAANRMRVDQRREKVPLPDDIQSMTPEQMATRPKEDLISQLEKAASRGDEATVDRIQEAVQRRGGELDQADNKRIADALMGLDEAIARRKTEVEARKKEYAQKDTFTVRADDPRLDLSENLGFTPSKAEQVKKPGDLPPVRVEIQDGKILVVDGRHRLKFSGRKQLEAEVVATDGSIDLPSAKRAPSERRKAQLLREISQLTRPAIGDEGSSLKSAQAEPGIRQGTGQVREQDFVTFRDFARVLSGDRGRRGIQTPFGRLFKKGGDAVQVPIATANSPIFRASKGVKAFYETNANAIRNRHRGEWGITAHEWAHAAHREAFGETEIYSPQAFDRAVRRMGTELIQRGYDGASLAREIATVLDGYNLGSVDAEKTVSDAYAGKIKGKDLNFVLAEAWAETTARMMLGDPTVYTEAPLLTDYISTKLAENPRLQSQFLKAQEVALTQAEMTAEQIVRAESISSKRAKKIRRQDQGPAWERVTAEVVEKLSDDLVRMRRATDRAKERAGQANADYDSSLEADPAEMADALRGLYPKIAQEFLNNETYDILGNKTGESLAQTFRDIEKTFNAGERGVQDFLDWMKSQRFVEQAQAGKKTPLRPDVYRDAILGLEAKYGRENLDRARVALNSYFNRLLDFQLEAGVLTVGDVNRIRKAGSYYVPLFRYIEEAAGRSTAGAAGGDSMKRARGSEREVLNIVEAMERVTTQAVQRAHTAMVKRSYYNLAQQPGASEIVIEVPRDIAMREIQNMDVLENMWRQASNLEGEQRYVLEQAIGELMDSPIGLDTFLSVALKNEPGQGSNIIAVNTKDGVKWLKVMDAAYLKPLETLNPAVSPLTNNIVAKVLKQPTRLLKYFATGINPAFAIANMFRDVFARSITATDGAAARYGFIGGFGEYFWGLGQLVKNTETYKQYNRVLGGGMSRWASDGMSRYAAENPRKAAKVERGNPLKYLEKFVSAFEQPLRIAAFERSYKQALKDEMASLEANMEPIAREFDINYGQPGALGQVAQAIELVAARRATLTALRDAREVTVNFAKGGVGSRILSDFFPYWNAGMVSQDKMWRALRTPGGMMRAIANITVPSFLLHLLNEDEEWYQDMPAWKKRAYWMHSFDGGESIISVPKPHQVGVLLGSIPVDMYEKGVQFDKDMRESLIQSFLPYADNALNTITPQAIKPVLEVGTGYSFFKQRELTPGYMKYRPGVEQVLDSTSFTAQAMYGLFPSFFNTLGVDNPIELEAFVGGYMTNRAMKTVFHGADAVGTIFGGDQDAMKKTWRELNKHTNPALRFFEDASMAPSKSIGQVYEERDRIQNIPPEERSPEDRDTLLRVRSVTRQFTQLDKLHRLGRISIEELRDKKRQLALDAFR
jgi:hypothetical protein